MAGRRTTIPSPSAPSSGGALVVSQEFDPEAPDRICAGLEEGVALEKLCSAPGIPPLNTVRGWIRNDKKFRARCLQALDMRALAESQNLLSIADNEDIPTPRAKLMIDTRKWLLDRRHNKDFGQKTAVEHGVTGDLADIFNAAMGRSDGHHLPADQEDRYIDVDYTEVE